MPSFPSRDFQDPVSEEEAASRKKEMFLSLAKHDSQNRSFWMVLELVGVPINVFWPVLLQNWPSCDRMAGEKNELLALMSMAKRKAGFYEFASQEARERFDALPEEVPVYRGCSRRVVRGLSWTTDQSTAEQFARGHRLVVVLSPVVATAVIPKDAIFFVGTGKEAEIVLNPRRLRRLSISDRPLFLFGA